MKPYAGQVIYDYKTTSPHELSIYAGQLIQLAPREVQQTHKLLNTGWALATIDNKTSGLVPINYVRRVESKPFVSQTNQTVIMPEASINENELKKDKFPLHTELNEEISQMYENKMPINSNECEHIDAIIPDDIKDL